MKQFILASIFSLLLLACTPASTDRPSTGNTPEELFHYLIEQTVPTEISNLKGTGDTWQGHNVYLTFNAPESYRQKLTTIHNYKKIDCKAITKDITLPAGWDAYLPSWDLKTITDAICYQATGYSNEWTSLGNSTIIIFSNTDTVLFHEVGI
ncbi:MAG: hypothetical protein WCP97_05600 [bacterium]